MLQTHTVLSFEDVLPMLPPKTKKCDVMPFLRDWYAKETAIIDEKKHELSNVN